MNYLLRSESRSTLDCVEEFKHGYLSVAVRIQELEANLIKLHVRTLQRDVVVVPRHDVRESQAAFLKIDLTSTVQIKDVKEALDDVLVRKSDLSHPHRERPFRHVFFGEIRPETEEFAAFLLGKSGFLAQFEERTEIF